MNDREVMQMALNALTEWDARGRLRVIEALRTALAQSEKEWVGLTEEDIAKNIYAEGKFMLPYSFASSIEAMLKEKNA